MFELLQDFWTGVREAAQGWAVTFYAKQFGKNERIQFYESLMGVLEDGIPIEEALETVAKAFSNDGKTMHPVSVICGQVAMLVREENLSPTPAGAICHMTRLPCSIPGENRQPCGGFPGLRSAHRGPPTHFSPGCLRRSASIDYLEPHGGAAVCHRHLDGAVDGSAARSRAVDRHPKSALCNFQGSHELRTSDRCSRADPGRRLVRDPPILLRPAGSTEQPGLENAAQLATADHQAAARRHSPGQSTKSCTAQSSC